MSVLLGRGDGTFADSVDYPVGGFPDAVAVGDLNGDGNLDVLIADTTKSVLLGKGDGTLADNARYEVDGSLALGDMNGDGWVDLVTANLDTVSIRLGHNDGTFAGKMVYLAGGHAAGVALGDLNGDGRLDLVVTGNHSVGVLLSSCR